MKRRFSLHFANALSHLQGAVEKDAFINRQHRCLHSTADNGRSSQFDFLFCEDFSRNLWELYLIVTKAEAQLVSFCSRSCTNFHS